MSDSPKPTRQPPVFWFGVGASVLALGLLITRLAMFGGQGGALALGIAIGIAIVVLVIAFFVWNVRSGIRSVAEAFPDAIHIPITVGSELAAASQRVAEALGRRLSSDAGEGRRLGWEMASVWQGALVWWAFTRSQPAGEAIREALENWVERALPGGLSIPG